MMHLAQTLPSTATAPALGLLDRLPLALRDPRMLALLAGVFVVLLTASILGLILRRRATTDKAKSTVENLIARTNAWWIMASLFLATGLLGPGPTTCLFGLLSFFALREMVTLSPTRRADHHTLFWLFFVITPFHYWLLYDRWYGLFAIFIPVYGFLFVCIRSTLTGDYKHYSERVARIFLALMICTYCASHAPALLTLDVVHFAGQNVKLLFFLAIVVQSSDVLQYVWGKLLGKHKIAPNISPNKTWEGFLGGTLSAAALSLALAWLTPFNLWQTALIAYALTLAGFAGGIVMSAIKRDAGVKDYSQLIPGHGGVMDRIDSLTFAAPLFFHITRYFFTTDLSPRG